MSASPCAWEGEAVVKVEDATAPGVVDDIVDDIIENNCATEVMCASFRTGCSPNTAASRW